jgi:Tfp pilus assembly protein PilZ
MGVERRRDRRHAFRFPMILSWGREEIVAQSEDVSFRGVFVRTDMPLPERQLVRLRVTLPPAGVELNAMGMVTRRLGPGSDRAPGVGIQFYAMGPEERERWHGFVRYVSALDAAQPGTAPAAPAPDTVRRRDPRYAVRLQVRLQTMDELELLYTRNVSKGGLFLGTTLQLPQGTSVRVSVVHPKTGEQFPLDAVVRWCAVSPHAGLGLEFTGTTEQRRDEFFDFIRSEIPVEEVVYVAQNDPRLDSPVRPTRFGLEPPSEPREPLRTGERPRASMIARIVNR